MEARWDANANTATKKAHCVGSAFHPLYSVVVYFYYVFQSPSSARPGDRDWRVNTQSTAAATQFLSNFDNNNTKYDKPINSTSECIESYHIPQSHAPNIISGKGTNRKNSRRMCRSNFRWAQWHICEGEQWRRWKELISRRWTRMCVSNVSMRWNVGSSMDYSEYNKIPGTNIASSVPKYVLIYRAPRINC